MKTKRQQQAQLLRRFRALHRLTGAWLFVFFFFIAVSGLFLGWKKNSAGLLLPQSQKGISTNLKTWLPLDSLNTLADGFLQQHLGKQVSLDLNRIDIRKNKGMLKFVYAADDWEVQLDGQTGALLSLNQRWSDWIENVHDGSVLDDYFQTKGWIKLCYTSITGLALLMFTITGFWLWYGPKQMRKAKREA